jgi:WD40 repeat protein
VGVPLGAVAFDPSGLYLACEARASKGTNADLQIFSTKDWAVVRTVAGVHAKPVTALAWGPDSTFLCSASTERAIKLLQPDA